MTTKSILTTAMAALALASASAATPEAIDIYTGKNAALTAVATAVKTATQMTPTEVEGVYTGTITLNYDPNGYYFAFGHVGNSSNNYNYMYYGPQKVTGGTPIDLASGASITSPVKEAEGVAGCCWYWGPANDEYWGIQDIGAIELQATLDLNKMEATISRGEPEPPVTPVPNSLEVQIGRYRSISAINSGTYFPLTKNGSLLECTFTLSEETGYFFCFQDKSNGRDLGPGTTSEVALNLADNESVTSSLSYGDNSNGNCWYWAPKEGSVVIKTTIDWSKMQVTIESLGAPKPEEPVETYDVTFKFATDNFVLGRHISNYVNVVDIETGEVLAINKNPYTYSFSKSPTGLNFSAIDGYEFNLECTNWTDDGTQPPFAITGNSLMAQDDELLEFGTQSVLTLLKEAEGLEFLVTLKRVPQENLPEKIYAMIGENGITLNQQLAPGPNDPYLVYNPESGFYEGTITLAKRRFKFYTPLEDGTYKVLGQNGSDAEGTFNFNAQYNPYVGECAWDASHCWYLGYTFNNLNEMGVKMEVNPNEGTVVFSPILPSAPQALYLYGSTDGGHEFTLDYTMTPSAENPNIFTVTVDAPNVGKGIWTDPDTGYQVEFEGWYFQIGYNDTHYNTGLFRGNERTNTTIDFSKMDAFSSTLTGRVPLNTLSYGQMTFVFDWSTLKFTAVSDEAPVDRTVTFEFVSETLDLTDVNEFVAVTDVMADAAQLDIDANPYSYSFNGNVAVLAFAAMDGYLIEIECTDYDGPADEAPFQIMGAGLMADDELLDFGTQFTVGLYAGANGLNFKVNVIEKKDSAVGSMEVEADSEALFYDLSGRRVVNPERGIYIKVHNGKAEKLVK